MEGAIDAVDVEKIVQLEIAEDLLCELDDAEDLVGRRGGHAAAMCQERWVAMQRCLDLLQAWRAECGISRGLRHVHLWEVLDSAEVRSRPQIVGRCD